jgi:K+-sensing histidine kinase KdpD
MRMTVEARLLGEQGAESVVRIISAPFLPPSATEWIAVTVMTELASSTTLGKLRHDLRDDLAAILLNAARMMLSAPDCVPATVREAFERIRQTSERMRMRLLAGV